MSGPNFYTLATIGRDGQPQLSSVWADLAADGQIDLCTFEGAAKTRNLRRDPRVTLSVANAENPYEFVSVNGHVSLETSEAGEELIDRLSMKYAGFPYRGHHLDRPWVRFRVQPVKVTHYASELYP